LNTCQQSSAFGRKLPLAGDRFRQRAGVKVRKVNLAPFAFSHSPTLPRICNDNY
jgi:hypothetical protein